MHKSNHLGRQSLLIVAGQRNLFFWRVNLQVWATRNTQPHPRNIFAVHITCKLVPVQFSLRTGFPGKWWILAGCTQLFLALSACCSQRPSFVLSMLPTVAHPQTSDMVVTVEGVSVIFALVPSWDTRARTDIAYKDGRTPFAITATGSERTGQSLLPLPEFHLSLLEFSFLVEHGTAAEMVSIN